MNSNASESLIQSGSNELDLMSDTELESESSKIKSYDFIESDDYEILD